MSRFVEVKKDVYVNAEVVGLVALKKEPDRNYANQENSWELYIAEKGFEEKRYWSYGSEEAAREVMNKILNPLL